FASSLVLARDRFSRIDAHGPSKARALHGRRRLSYQGGSVMKMTAMIAAVIGLVALASCSRNNDRPAESASSAEAKEAKDGGGSAKDGGVLSGALGVFAEDGSAMEARDGGAASPTTRSGK